MNDQPSNQKIANVLDRIAELLEAQEANPHRVRAYRTGASRARNLDRSLAEIVRSGDGQALQSLPDIGEGLARVISDYVQTGRSNVLDRIQGNFSPKKLFAQVPGVGDVLADRIVKQLDINSLEELEQAAHDGRLSEIEGFGPGRVQTVLMSLAGMLSPAAQRRSQQRNRGETSERPDRPGVGTLLDLDAEYRRKAAAGKLTQIAPRRFNPERKAWLPVMHATRGEWGFTVLYSNTARAHELDKTHDWVVIYYDWNGSDGQATVVTATYGELNGKRIVRGREVECERYYKDAADRRDRQTS